ncbi:MAG: 30S ribosome-binding factor RbfA [Candidatus Saganbacteria bacterium]|nr:30S ribosome-binding factor RbfA [Candidatus Saganbacteria bacterium]
MSSIRLEKLAALVKESVSSIITKDLNDPRIGFVSITDVTVTPDLGHVKIYISCMGDEQAQSQSMQGLSSATPFVRGKLGKALFLRFVPEICFIQDTSLERGSRVLTLMNNLQQKEEKEKKNEKKHTVGNKKKNTKSK